MKSFRVSNFRLFDSEGTEVKFKPVTVLTGANSSGKSSFVKAMVVFGQYMDTVISECRRDGSYNPSKGKLDFSDPKLQLMGYSKVANRYLSEDTPMSFSMELFPPISCYGGYNVTFSFVPDDLDNTLDQGVLQSISIDVDGERVLRIENVKETKTIKKGKEEEEIEIRVSRLTHLNHNRLIPDFLAFCRYCILPSRIIKNSIDEEYRDIDPDYRDPDGSFNSEKAANTKMGKRLAKIQGRDVATFDYTSIVSRVSPKVQDKLKSLFCCDLFDPVEKCLEYSLFFYFPVLERFVGKSKAEAIDILHNECRSSESMNVIRNEEEVLKQNLAELIRDYESSEVESFLDYYRGLENYILENYDKNSFNIHRWGESFNFIEDRILPNISISYGEGGFDTRHDKGGRLFKIAYDVLSSWQWAEDENKDSQWKHYNDGAIVELWGNNEPFITRHIHELGSFSSRHILLEAYQDYLRYVLPECLMPGDLSKFKYNTGSFASVQRLHSFEEGTDFVETIREYLDGCSYWKKYCSKPIWGSERFDSYIPDTFLNKWLGTHGLNICESIRIENVQGLGFIITMVKSNGEEEQLADMGHGITQMVSILLQIESVLVRNEIKDYEKMALDDGYGEMKETNTIIAIEEPEVSLHPCYQSLMAEILKDAVSYGLGLSFIIETHSEYFVRKMQAIVSSFTNKEFEANPFVVYYFKEDGEVYDLGFMNTGRFEKGFGPGFFDEAANLKFELQTNELKK